MRYFFGNKNAREGGNKESGFKGLWAKIFPIFFSAHVLKKMVPGGPNKKIPKFTINFQRLYLGSGEMRRTRCGARGAQDPVVGLQKIHVLVSIVDWGPQSSIAKGIFNKSMSSWDPWKWTLGSSWIILDDETLKKASSRMMVLQSLKPSFPLCQSILPRRPLGKQCMMIRSAIC